MNDIYSEKIMVKYKKLSSFAKCPVRAKLGDAGFDVFSTEYLILNPLEVKTVSLGIAIELPEGYYCDINPRSGLAIKNGIHVLGGIVDSSYRGEIKVILVNLMGAAYLFNGVSRQELSIGSLSGKMPGCLEIKPGDKIAQFIFKKYEDVDWVEVNELNNSERGGAGFGSTG